MRPVATEGCKENPPRNRSEGDRRKPDGTTGDGGRAPSAYGGPGIALDPKPRTQNPEPRIHRHLHQGQVEVALQAPRGDLPAFAQASGEGGVPPRSEHDRAANRDVRVVHLDQRVSRAVFRGRPRGSSRYSRLLRPSAMVPEARVPKHGERGYARRGIRSIRLGRRPKAFGTVASHHGDSLSGNRSFSFGVMTVIVMAPVLVLVGFQAGPSVPVGPSSLGKASFLVSVAVLIYSDILIPVRLVSSSILIPVAAPVSSDAPIPVGVLVVPSVLVRLSILVRLGILVRLNAWSSSASWSGSVSWSGSASRSGSASWSGSMSWSGSASWSGSVSGSGSASWSGSAS